MADTEINAEAGDGQPKTAAQLKKVAAERKKQEKMAKFQAKQEKLKAQPKKEQKQTNDDAVSFPSHMY